ncbi:hypothetical protein HAX54_000620 [Datura stramonium]|uniref:Uncharacterized protein n=1 Tax=Datura stramonium TaxID=4076 RepID=A0ABS8RSH0_DATST|nr:hypothetical protein [Datura stramonium]
MKFSLGTCLAFRLLDSMKLLIQLLEASISMTLLEPQFLFEILLCFEIECQPSFPLGYKSSRKFFGPWEFSGRFNIRSLHIAEIESKIQKIIAYLKGEDGGDEKEPLVELVEDFHNHYQSLYARYDYLTGKLRENVHGKHEKDKVTDDIKEELASANLEIADLKAQLMAAKEEKEVLHSEHQSTFLRKLQEAETTISSSD